MRPVRGKRILAILAVGGLTLTAAACGKAPDETPSGGSASTATAAAYKACMVTDTGGIDDKSFNASAWAGIQAAKAQASNVDPKYVASTAEADYEPNLRGFVTQKCNFILAVGGLMGDATKKVSDENASSQFAIVDSGSTGANVYPMQFATDQAAFLAGYLAAGYSKTGTVATFGGLKIPPVTVFMDGFADGVAYYNQAKGKSVKVLGWDPVSKEGLFTNNFESLSDGREFAKNLNDEGADIIMPVAGPVGQGSSALAMELGADKLKIIGVDVDWYDTVPEHKSVFLTSVMKRMDTTTIEAIKQAKDGTFKGGVTVGTLANDGVAIAPFHDIDAQIPAELKSELDTIRKGIIDGKISVKG